MAIQDDFSIAVNGDIRRTGTGATTYTVLQLHRWLQDAADNASVLADDLIDITSSTPSDRATDNIITLINGYNIDDNAAKYLYDGSIDQAGGATQYSGLVVVGAVEAGTELQIIQNNVVLESYWGTGLNADAALSILLRVMVKTRSGGTDIDGKRLRVQARELSDRFAEFLVTAGAGNSVAAVFTSNDLNNQTAAATIAGWTTITNTEGLRLINVDGIGGTEEYYSEWNKGTQSINQLYERTKWLAKRALPESSNTETGTNYQLYGAATPRHGQSFAVGVNPVRIVRARARLKKVGSPTGNLTVSIYAHSGTFGTSSVGTGAALATSENIDVSKLTTAYAEQEIRFTTLATQVVLSASTNYVVAFEYSGGDVSNYVHVEGDATGTHAGNKSSYNGSVWAAQAAEDLWFRVYTSPTLYGMPAELFRGITHSFAYDGETSGPFVQNAILTWGTGVTAGTGAILALDDDGTTGNLYIQLLTGVVPTDNLTLTSGATTALVNGTVTARTVSAEFLGQSTGSAVIGAYGVGIEAADLSASDLLFDLTNTPRTPPNNVTFTVNGLVIGEDRLIVTQDDTGLDYNQRTLATSLTGATETAVVVTVAIPSDTPATGTIRIQLDNGTYRLVPYLSFTGSTFTIASTDFSGANAATQPRNVFIAYIDKLATSTSESFTVVFSAPRTLFVRVRDGGGTPIKTAETTGSLGSAGGSVTINRITDA